MLNVFYWNSAIWLGILLLYSFGWSDLCIPLSGQTIAFLLVMIATSFGVGFLLRRKLAFYTLQENKHKVHFTLLLVVFFIADFLYEKSVPLFAVLSGDSMYERAFNGIPGLHLLMTGVVILYSFYLFYLFLCFRRWTILVEYALCFGFFLLLFQRQNMVVIAAGAVWLTLAYIFSRKLSPKQRRWLIIATISCVIVIAAVGLYIFGLMGNARYGIWSPTDSTMIMEVGRINDRYPAFLPKTFSWAYVYLTSPLANLQHNINAGVQAGTGVFDFLSNFIPHYFSSYYGESQVTLPVLSEALIVCTAFAAACRCIGIGGAYLLYFYILAVTVGAVYLTSRHRRMFIPCVVGFGYFVFLNFFDNAVVYIVSACMILYPVLAVLGILYIKWGRIAWRRLRVALVAAGAITDAQTGTEATTEEEPCEADGVDAPNEAVDVPDEAGDASDETGDVPPAEEDT